jgi:hypothetical protein
MKSGGKNEKSCNLHHEKRVCEKQRTKIRSLNESFIPTEI